MDSTEIPLLGKQSKSLHPVRFVSTRYRHLLLSMVLAGVVSATSLRRAETICLGKTPRGDSSGSPTLGERLVQEYAKEAGLGTTPELQKISDYVAGIGARVSGALPSSPKYHFLLDPNPGFESAFALPERNVIVGGGLLAIVQTEDELANVLAHEIEHVELNQVGARLLTLLKTKSEAQIHVDDFYPGYTKQEELACDLTGQQLAARAGYSPAGMLTLLETFQALRKGEAEAPSDAHPTLLERIAQAKPLAKAANQHQAPLRLP